jgi:protease PrsW
MIRLIISIFGAIVPIIVIIVYLKKLNNHLPWSQILLTLLIGIGITIIYGAVLGFFKLDLKIENPFLNAFYTAFFRAAVPEEIIKYIILLCSWYSFLKIQNELQGIVYGSVCALGFALLENIEYVNTGGLNIALLRAFTSVPAHALFGALMGYLFSKYILKKKIIYLIYCLLFPILLHTAYDFILMLTEKMYVSENHLSNLAIGLLISTFIIFIVIEFGKILNLVLVSARNQVISDISTNDNQSEKEILLDTLSIPSVLSIQNSVRQYVYIFAAIILLIMKMPVGILMVLFLRTIINMNFRPIKIKRTLIKYQDDT